MNEKLKKNKRRVNHFDDADNPVSWNALANQTIIDDKFMQIREKFCHILFILKLILGVSESNEF